MTQFLYENYEARQYKEKLRQEKMSKMIGYLMKHNIKINDSIDDTDLEALYLLYLSMDPDFLSSDLIEAERDSRFGAVCNAIVSLLKNTADALSIPSISKIIKTVGSTAIGHALTAGRIATSTANDIFQDLDKRRDKGEVLRKLDEEDSVFRIYSSFMEYYEKLSEDYKKIYPSFARQFAMFGAMNQRPEDANLSRLFVKQFTYQLGTIFESGEYEFLPIRYKNIKDEMWWLNANYLNKSYKLSKQFIPGMMGLGTSFISGIPDINAFSFFSNLAEYGNVDVDELRNYYDSKKIPAVKTISISPGNSKKSKYDDKKSYDDSNKSIDFSNLESPFEVFNFSSDYFSDSIDSFQKLITEAGYFDDENYTTSLLPENYGMADDIMSSLNVPVDVSSLLGESNTFNLTESMLLPSSAGQAVGAGFSLFPGSVGSLDSLFGMGGGISIPLQYEIEVKGLEQFGSLKEKAEEAGEAVEESGGTFSNFSAEMMRQFMKLEEEKRAAFSVDLSMLPLNMLGIGGAPFQFSLPVEESKQFSETLSDIAGIAGQLGGAFMKVNY